MRVAHIPVLAEIDITLPEALLSQLPVKVALFTTAQLIHQYELMAAQLEQAGKTVIRIKTPHTRYDGQLLGCNLQPIHDFNKVEFDGILYVGDGLFHPRALLWKNKVDTLMYNPFNDEISSATDADVVRIMKRHQAALSAFQMATTVGVLLPVKPGGQLYLRWALELQKLYPDKTFVNLVDYNIDFDSLQNFPFCEVFVNTACPRIPFEDGGKLHKPVVNLEDVSKNFYEKQLLSVFVPGKTAK